MTDFDDDMPRAVAKDQAAVITTAVFQMVAAAMDARMRGDYAALPRARAATESLIRDALADQARTTAGERDAPLLEEVPACPGRRVHHEEVIGRFRDAIPSSLSASQAADVVLDQIDGATRKQLVAAAIDLLRKREAKHAADLRRARS